MGLEIARASFWVYKMPDTSHYHSRIYIMGLEHAEGAYVFTRMHMRHVSVVMWVCMRTPPHQIYGKVSSRLSKHDTPRLECNIYIYIYIFLSTAKILTKHGTSPPG